MRGNMTDAEFLDYMTAAAEDRTMVSAEQVNRLLDMLPKREPNPPRLRPGWWGTIDPANVAWAREAIKKHANRAERAEA